MRQPCKFQKVDGKWKCKSCNHICPLPHNRPPVRTCGTEYITPPPRKPTPKFKPTPKLKPTPRRKSKRRKPTPPPPIQRLDVKITKALKMVDVDESLIEKYLGVPCGCGERREKVAKLYAYVDRILNDEKDMKQHLLDLLGE